MALVRAEESRRPDRLFDDPLAEAFLRAVPGGFAEERAATAAAAEDKVWAANFGAGPVLRTRFFDDYLTDAVQHSARQVVLLAAGFDTRAYRLFWPAGIRLFELDLPDVLEFKERVLTENGASARCMRQAVPADLYGDWPRTLCDAGFDPAQSTAWLAEGILIYLTAAAAATVLSSVGELSAPGSRIAFEHLPAAALREKARRMPVVAEFADMWRGGLPDPAAWLATRGWRAELHDRVLLASVYGRGGRGAPSGGGFVTATREG